MRSMKYEVLTAPQTCSICEEIIPKEIEKAISFVAVGLEAKRHYIHKKCVGYLNEAMYEETEDELA